MVMLLFLLATFLARLLLSQYFPLIGDEAYYWLWSQNLDLSYVDHPPLIAYYIKAMTLLFGNSLLAIHLGAVILVTITTWLVYKIGQALFSAKAGLTAAIIFNLLPMFLGGGMFLVPQQLFMLFWALSLYLFIIIVKTNQPRLWYLLGLSVGLGLLSDYIMLLFFPAVGLYLWLNPKQRPWWKRKEPYLGLLLALAVFAPVIIWNIKQGFTPLAYLSYRRQETSVNYLQNSLSFLGLAIVLYTPILFSLAFSLLKWLKRFEAKITLLSCFSAASLLPFLLICPFILVGGHWPAVAFIPVILNLSQMTGKKQTWLIGLTLFFACLVNGLVFTYYLAYFPIPQDLVGQEETINKALPEFLKSAQAEKGRTYYFANNLGLAGLVSFHGQVKTYLAHGRHKQFDIWGQPKLERGDNIIYFVLNEREMQDKLPPLFRQVKKEAKKRVFAKDADIPNKTEIFHCYDYQGGTLP